MAAPPSTQEHYHRIDHGAHVLIVEDNPVTLRFLSAAMVENGYRLSLVSTTADALAKIDQELPDLLVLDLFLPDGHGLEVCRHLRQCLGGEDVPVLVVTVEDAPDGHAQAVRAGVDDFLRKPIHPVELKSRARSLLRLRHLKLELRAEREALIKMQAQKENLLQYVAHDLKNLLGVARATLDLMGSDVRSPQDLRYQDRMGSALQSMLGMIRDFLDLSIGDRAEMAVNITSFELGPWLEKVIHELEPLASRGNRRMALAVPQGLSVTADPQLLQRVVANLLENALRFAPAGSSVQVEACPASDGSVVRILVCDQGPGIPDEKKLTVFDRFVRLKGLQESPSGRGLGLAFCRLVMDMHHGRVWVEDNEPAGSRFMLELPNPVLNG